MKIETLLDKYFEGETTPNGEKILKEFFSGDKVPSELQVFKPLFVYFENEQNEELAHINFDKSLTYKILNIDHLGFKQKSKINIWQITGIAASFIILLGAGLYYAYFYKGELTVDNLPAISKNINLDKFLDKVAGFDQKFSGQVFHRDRCRNLYFSDTLHLWLYRRGRRCDRGGLLERLGIVNDRLGLFLEFRGRCFWF